MSELAIDKLISEAKLESGANKPPFDELIDAIAGEAVLLEGSMRAILIAGLAQTPDPKQIRRIVCLDATHSFLRACKERPREVAKRLTAPKKEAVS